MKLIRNLIVTGCLIFLIPYFPRPSAHHLPDEVNPLVFFVISDTHGWLDSKIQYPRRKAFGLKYIVKAVEELRKQYPKLIVLNTGDFLSGSPLSIYHIKRQTPIDDNPIFRAFEKLTPHISTVGNHDMEFFSYHKKYLLNDLGSFTTSNLEDNDGKLIFPSHLSIKFKSKKIHFIGAITTGTNIWSDPAEKSVFHVTDAAKSIKDTLIEIAPSKSDIIIGLLHTGIQRYRDFQVSLMHSQPRFNDGYRIAEQFPQFDLIIAGHDHRLSPSKDDKPIETVFGTPVIQPGYWGKKAVLLKIFLNENESGGITSIKHSIIDSSKYEIKNNAENQPDAEFSGYLNQGSSWVLNKKADLENCLNKALSDSLKFDGTELTFLPPLLLKPLYLRAGKEIQRKHLHYWLPYPNKPVTLHLSSRDIFNLMGIISPIEGRKTPYNLRMKVFWKGAELTPGNLNMSGLTNTGWESFQRKWPAILTNYHANGGGGLIPRLLLHEKDWERRQETFHEILFKHMLNSNPPFACSMFKKKQ